MRDNLQTGFFYLGWCIFIAYVFGTTVSFVLETGSNALWAAFVGLLAYGSHFMLWEFAAVALNSRPLISLQRDLSTLQARWRSSLPRLFLVTAMLGVFNIAWFAPIGAWVLLTARPSSWLPLGITVLCWLAVFGPTQLRILLQCWDSYRGVQLDAKTNTLHVVSWERGRRQDRRIGLAGLVVTENRDGIQVASGDQGFTLLAAAPEDSQQLIAALQALSQSVQPTGSQQDVPKELRTLARPRQSQ